MWFIGVEVEQETGAPPPKKNPGSASGLLYVLLQGGSLSYYKGDGKRLNSKQNKVAKQQLCS